MNLQFVTYMKKQWKFRNFILMNMFSLYIFFLFRLQYSKFVIMIQYILIIPQHF